MGIVIRASQVNSVYYLEQRNRHFVELLILVRRSSLRVLTMATAKVALAIRIGIHIFIPYRSSKGLSPLHSLQLLPYTAISDRNHNAIVAISHAMATTNVTLGATYAGTTFYEGMAAVVSIMATTMTIIRTESVSGRYLFATGVRVSTPATALTVDGEPYSDVATPYGTSTHVSPTPDRISASRGDHRLVSIY